jgi:hypothetical protein
MNINTHQAGNKRIAEIISDIVVIHNASDGLNLMGNLYYENYDGILLHEHLLSPDFFNLSNGMAGEILQKFSNYRMQLAIVGNFENYTHKSINDFMFESNKTGHIIFVGSVSEALKRLSKC